MTRENLKEEVFHALQDAYYPGGTAQYTDTGKVNIEFEAKLFYDLASDGCCIAFNIGTTAPPEVQEDYLNWIISIKDNSMNINVEDYRNWLDFYNQYTPAYSSPLAPELSSPDVLNAVFLSSNCY